MMGRRFFYLALVLLLAVMTTAYVGWTANRLVHAETNNFEQWQKRMIGATRERGDQIRLWLQEQQKMITELAIDPRITDSLRQHANHTEETPLQTPQADRAAFEFGTLKYGINHVYVFNRNSEQIGKSEKSRSLPISLREHLARAYATSLEDYSVMLTIDSSNWMLVSRRVRERGENLGYVAYLQEIEVALNTLAAKPAGTRAMNFLLARRVGDADVYLMTVDEKSPRLFRYPLSELPLPVFKAATPMFGLHKGLTGQPTMVNIDIVPGHAFWQLANLVPADAIRESVSQTRFIYLGLAVIVTLILLFLLFSLSRRIVWPDATFIPFKNSLRRAWESHTVGGNAPRYLSYQGSPSSNWKTNTPPPAPERPRGLLGLLKSRPWGRFLGKATTREVSDAEIADLKGHKPPPKAATVNAGAKIAPKAAPKPEPKPEPTPEPAAKAEAKSAPEAANTLRAEVLPDEPALEEKKPEKPPVERPVVKAPEVSEEERIKEIMRCLRDERLRLFFQPIVDINNNQRVMFETLLRLVKENGDLMMPGEFIPLAIKHGFIGDIDDAVIAASLRRHMEILTQGKATTLSINLSYGAFASHQFMETFELGLASGRIKPQYINFEVASRELIEDPKGMEFIRDMRENGCKFSVDFFGDLRVVEAAKRMGFNYMKVDCLKFKGLEEGNAEQVAAFRNLIVEAQKHGLPLIAEKVENKAVWWLCKRLGVPMVQGFYIAEPSPRLDLGW